MCKILIKIQASIYLPPPPYSATAPSHGEVAYRPQAQLWTHLVVWLEEKVTVYIAAGQTAKGTKTNSRAEGHREGQAGIQGFRQKPYGKL